MNFSEAFTAWIHVKVLRVFVESVLRYARLFVGINKKQKLINFSFFFLSFRYGLPVNFQTVLIQPNKKSLKKLREVLQNLYGHLDTGGLMADKSEVRRLTFIRSIYFSKFFQWFFCIDPFIYWLIDWLFDWLIDWLIDWSFVCLIVWLIDWLIGWLVFTVVLPGARYCGNWYVIEPGLLSVRLLFHQHRRCLGSHQVVIRPHQPRSYLFLRCFLSDSDVHDVGVIHGTRVFDIPQLDWTRLLNIINQVILEVLSSRPFCLSRVICLAKCFFSLWCWASVDRDCCICHSKKNYIKILTPLEIFKATVLKKESGTWQNASISMYRSQQRPLAVMEKRRSETPSHSR